MNLSLFEGYVWCSREVRAWVEMEREELMSSSVKMILPDSSLLKNELITNHPLLSTLKVENRLVWSSVTH